MSGILKIYLFALLFTMIQNFILGQGNIQVIMDPRIETLIQKQGTPIPPATSVQIDGYRLQLIFDSEKNKIDQARLQFSQRFPKIETYVKYSAPNYILKVGDFRTQLEADRLKAEVGSLYPMSFVVREKVNLPRID